VIVTVSFTTIAITFGVRLSFSVFFVALIEEFNWLRGDTAFIFSVSMGVFAATSTAAGILMDRWGVRRTFLLGGIFLTLGLFLSSCVDTFWGLVITYGLIASLGITILGLGPQAALIARWFRKRRGLAIGIAFAGTGIGALLLTPGIELLISAQGWRRAYAFLGLLSLVVIPLNGFLLHRKLPEESRAAEEMATQTSPEKVPERAWRIQAVIRSPAFWMLLIASIGAIGPVRMLTVHQLAVITDAGYTRSFAAQIIGVSGLVTAIAFILWGALSDRVDRRIVYMLGSISLLTAILILNQLPPPGGSILWLGAYALLLGIGEGSRASLVTSIASDLFPGPALGAVNGTMGAAFGLGAALFPWLAGRLFDLNGAYTSAFLVAGIAVVISGMLLFQATRLARM
jgi:MFS family permease